MEFKNYDIETGEWIFRAKHFTKYGLDEGDEDSEGEQHEAEEYEEEESKHLEEEEDEDADYEAPIDEEQYYQNQDSHPYSRNKHDQSKPFMQSNAIQTETQVFLPQ